MFLRARRTQWGNAAVEFALAATAFFTVLFGIIDFGYIFWVTLTMQHAAREGARYAVTGQTNLDPDPGPSATDRCNAATAKIRDASMGLYDQLSPTITFKTVDAGTGNITTLGSGACYGAGQIIIIQLDVSVRPPTGFTQPFFPGGNYAFRVSTTMKNEAF